ncbi:MAG TPA: retropepsin-like aspartic protease [Acetobacteraceae bacterium]|jgi:predicted aspartyl protease
MRAIACLFFLLLLSACATPASCPLVALARMPLYADNNLMFVPARINGRPVRLLVDTGSERTVLTEAAVARLGLPHAGRFITRTVGVSGMSAEWDAAVPGIVLGGTRFPVDRVAVGNFSLGRLSDPPIDGLLGADILLAFDMDIDLPTHQLTLYRVRRCPGARPPWHEPAVEIEGVASRRDRLLVPITLDDTRGMAILDTGAQASTIGMPFALKAGVSAHDLEQDRAVLVHGASPGAVRVRVHQFEELRVGPAVFDDPKLAIVPAASGVGDALIGEDFLRGRRVWLSFATHHLFISKEIAAAPMVGVR